MADLIKDFGNGLGFIYRTQPDGTTILGNWANSRRGAINARRQALISGPLAGEVLSSGSVTLSGPVGTITDLTVNGVSIFNTASAISGVSLEEVCQNAVTAINGFTSSPNYTAICVGTEIVIFAVVGSGTTPNGFVVATATTAGMVATNVNMNGGSSGQGEYDEGLGDRYFLNADFGGVTANEGDLTGAVEITHILNARPLNSTMFSQSHTISNGSVVPKRVALLSVITVDTEGGAGFDDLDFIDNTGFQDGDILILRGVTPLRIVTVKSLTGNISLAGGADFLTGTPSSMLMLQFITDGVSNNWYEIARGQDQVFTNVGWRMAGYPFPAGGYSVNTLATIGGVQLLDPAVTPRFWRAEGAGTLTGSWSIDGTGTPIDGDQFEVEYTATFAPNGNNVTIFGISLTDDQISSGNVKVVATYDGTAAAWKSQLFTDTDGVDIATTAGLATKEDALGNPAANGYVLSSDTSGTRTWVPNGQQLLADDLGTYSTDGSISEQQLGTTLQLPAGSLVDGDALRFIAGGSFGGTANAKTLRLKFNGTTIIFNNVTAAPNGKDWRIDGTLHRSANSQLKGALTLSIDGEQVETQNNQLGGLNLDGVTYNMIVTGEDTAAVINEVTLTSFSVYTVR